MRAIVGWAAILAVVTVVRGQTTSNMTQLGTYLRPGTTSASAGIWGWTSPVTGKEYALMSSRTPGGLVVVDISTPTAPALNVYLPAGHNSIWFEVNSCGNYAYMVSQQGEMGLFIVDLSPLNTGGQARLVRKDTTVFKVAHALYCDGTASPPRIYATYGQSQGVVILSLADPERPREVGRIPGESHDMYARGNRLYTLTQRRGTVEIVDVANPAAITRLGIINLAAKSRELGEIAAGANTIAHNAWPSEDGRTLFTTEEIVGAYGKSWDISNPAAPRYLGRYLGVSGVIAHNFYVKGNRLYVAHNRGGLRAVDIGNPANMRELGWHRPANNGNSWGAYPWFKSGTVIHGDDRLGLFVVRDDTPPTSLAPEMAKKFRLARAGGLPLPASSVPIPVFSPLGREIFRIAPGSEGDGARLPAGRPAAGAAILGLARRSP